MGRDTTTALAPHEIARIRGGRRAAVTVAVLDLHLHGAVDAGRGGTMQTSGPTDGRIAAPLTKAVHASLYRPAGMRQLLDRQGVRTALAELGRDLTAAGLLRAFPPGRTRAARRLLKELRETHPLPIRRSGLSAEARLLLVAVHGDAALTLLAPRFAREAGLVGRGGTTERELRQSWGGGGGGFSCGTV
ncbi:TIGR04222 domain-containing membrane protein [Streptomyces sp. NPDC004752]